MLHLQPNYLFRLMQYSTPADYEALWIRTSFVTSEDSNLIPVGSHSHCMLVKTFTYFSTKPDLVSSVIGNARLFTYCYYSTILSIRYSV